jgi:APA family basic amino acid/polyamine antiporter
MFALTTTLNSCLGWITKPILQASIDGWFPKILAKIHPKYKTPVVILTLFYIIGLIPIVFGIDLGTIANMTVILTSIIFAMVEFSAMRIRQKLPELWGKSNFHVPDKVLIVISVLAGIASLSQIGLLVMVGEVTPKLLVSNAALLVVGMVYIIWRDKSGKVNIEVSYEES